MITKEEALDQLKIWHAMMTCDDDYPINSLHQRYVETIEIAIDAVIESDNCGNYVIIQSTVDKKNEKTKYCDRNICVSNEYNGIRCNECEVTKSQEPFLMREATKEESESVNNYVKSISKPTGIKFHKVLEQEPREGHWIRWYEIIEQGHCTIHDPHCKCSECNQEYDPYMASLFNYCPNCGIKIVEQPQESEE